MNFQYEENNIYERLGVVVRGFGIWLTLGSNFLQLSWGRTQ